eukprot:5448337-Pleurochrysis_carterae.AAC.1
MKEEQLEGQNRRARRCERAKRREEDAASLSALRLGWRGAAQLQSAVLVDWVCCSHAPGLREAIGFDERGGAAERASGG